MRRSGRACRSCAWRRSEQAVEGEAVRGAAGAEDEGVARVLPLEGAGEADAVGEFGFQVLEAVDGEVDAPVEQGLVDFLAE